MTDPTWRRFTQGDLRQHGQRVKTKVTLKRTLGSSLRKRLGCKQSILGVNEAKLKQENEPWVGRRVKNKTEYSVKCELGQGI